MHQLNKILINWSINSNTWKRKMFLLNLMFRLIASDVIQIFIENTFLLARCNVWFMFSWKLLLWTQLLRVYYDMICIEHRAQSTQHTNWLKLLLSMCTGCHSIQMKKNKLKYTFIHVEIENKETLWKRSNSVILIKIRFYLKFTFVISR